MNGIRMKVMMNHNKRINAAALILATAATLCLPQILHGEENSLVFTNSIFAVLVWGLAFYTLRQSLAAAPWKEKRGNRISLVFSLSFTVAMLFGVRLDMAQNVDFKDLRLWISLPVLTLFFAILIRRMWDLLHERTEKGVKKTVSDAIMWPLQQRENRTDLISFLVIFLCWIPVFLAVYPGFFVYDAQDEYVQVATRMFSTHHPLVHVLLLGGMICAVHKVLGSYNMGIACYILLQMLCVSGGFAFLLSYLRRKKVSRVVYFAGVLYFALFPVIVMFALCSAKDALFTTALLLLLVCLLEMGLDRARFFASKRWMFLFVISAAAMMLFRNNGLYAFVLMIPVLVFSHKRYRGRVLLCAVCAVAGCLLINTGLKAVLHADDSENQEILTVPIQQLARTYKYTPEVFDEEDTKTLHEILPEDALRMYNARLSDSVKVRFENETFQKDKSKYAWLWLKIGLRKPLSYLNAWWMTSYGFWYPDAVVNVYQGNSVFTFTYEDSSYFGYEVEQPGARDSKIPWLDEIYRKLSLEIWKEKVPVFSMLFSMGGMFWLYAFCFTYFVYMRKYRMLLPFFMIFFVWLTVVLGPTYLPRYVLMFWFGLPLLAGMVLEEDRMYAV